MVSGAAVLSSYPTRGSRASADGTLSRLIADQLNAEVWRPSVAAGGTSTRWPASWAAWRAAHNHAVRPQERAERHRQTFRVSPLAVPGRSDAATDALSPTE